MLTINILSPDIQEDIAAIARIPIISTIFEVICRTTGMGFSAIARVTDTQWITCSVRDEIAFGLVPGDELSLETTICNEIRQSHQQVVIDNVAQDQVFCGHHTPALYGFQSYISVPIFKKDKSFFGTLCAIDPKPAKLNNPEIIGMFRLFADLISFHLDAVENIASSEARLTAELKTAELREQFIAILGHDLKNPVGAIRSGSELLLRATTDSKIQKIAHLINNSSYRITNLVDNLLDFARGRLGGGLSLQLTTSNKLDSVLNQVVNELQTLYPDYKIETTFTLEVSVTCDENRIAQLFSNILGNAISHGSKEMPVQVIAKSDENTFSLSVTNWGDPIPEEKLQYLFQPFYRGKDSSKGLGLGLFIAAEIAKAHHGQLLVSSTNKTTTFTLEMPV